MTLEQFVNRVIHLNLDGVQVCDHLRYFDLPEYKLREIRKKIEDKGMFIETGASTCDPRYLETILKVSSTIGAKVLRAIPEIDRDGSEKCIHDQLDCIIDDLADVLTSAKNLGVRLALENHAHLASEELIYIVKSIEDSFVGVCLDTMNSIVLMEHPLVTAQALAPYAITVHLKDFRIEKNPRGHRIIGTPVGEGLVDMPKIVQIIRETNLDPNINLELFIDKCASEEDTLRWEEECVLKSIHYARRELSI